MGSQITIEAAAWSVVVGMVAVPNTAFAHLPPPPPTHYNAFGPLQVCTGLYTVDIGANEAVHVVGDFVRIINDHELLALKIIKQPTGNIASSLDGSIALDNQSRAYRYAFPTPDESDAVKWEPLALRENDVRYAIVTPEKQLSGRGKERGGVQLPRTAGICRSGRSAMRHPNLTTNSFQIRWTL
jgi:hypothetical protein